MMAFWDRCRRWLWEIFGLGPSVSLPLDDELQPQRPRVLLIVYNPILHSEGGRRLTDVLGWHDVDALTRDFIADVRECSNGLVEYQVVERLEVDGWPVKVDGFRYDEHSFLDCWRSHTGWHQPDAVDYEAILAEFDLFARIESGQVDEIWLFASPYAGFYESVMVGPDAFWCNSPPLLHTEGLSRRFVIMGFNYERGVGEMLESLGHRVESQLRYAWRMQQGEDNLWERFIRYDKTTPGGANCGWMHYAPNSQTDYDWGNPEVVLSNCEDWLNFPDFQGVVQQVDCRTWGGGDIRTHHKWWLAHLPKAPGQTMGLSNNWWRHGVDPNAVR